MRLFPFLIHTRRFPSRRFHAITLFPFVFFNGQPLDDSELRHETVHLWQQMALLFVLFYMLYLAFWLLNIIRFRDPYRAYMNIPFERSAYILEKQQPVSPIRQSFHWLRCL